MTELQDLIFDFDDEIEEGGPPVTSTQTQPPLTVEASPSTTSTGLYKGDPMVPVYGTFSSSLPTKSVVEIIANGIDDTRCAKLAPSRPAGNYAFMVDIGPHILFEILGIFLGIFVILGKLHVKTGSISGCFFVKSARNYE